MPRGWAWLLLFEAGCRLTNMVPWAIKRPVVNLIAHIVFRLSAKMRASTSSNMAVMLGAAAGDDTVRRLARRSIENFLLQALSMAEAYLAPPVELHRQLHFYSPTARQRAHHIAYNGPVIVATCHFGTWDAAASWGASLSEIHVVQESFANPGMTEVFRRLRVHLGMKSLDMRRDIRQMFSVLRKGGRVAILVDRPLEQGGVPVTWFGRITRLPAGVAKLAIRTNAEIVPLVVYRGGSGQAILRVAESIIPDRSAPREAEVKRLLQATVASLERLIRTAPDQWYQFRTFWPASEC
ncbi:MAG: lysophospholipid acyltransferase family protein [Chloroflexi bacterium]|nr:lysophospholipid acyltransferase family protein [Chloroflexota bacterium]